MAARTSSFHFKGKDTTIAEVGRALQVATVLEGSVRKSGTRVRISVQLVKVEDGYHLWSETYDRTLDDVFAVQDDIAQAVVKELRVTLLGEAADSDASREAKAEVARAAQGRATAPEAHRLFLLARHLHDRGSREDHFKAVEYLNAALAIDRQFALAWAHLAQAYSRMADMGWTSVAEGYALAREAAVRSLTLEPNLAEGHAQLGWIRFAHDWDWRGAESAYARALQLAPGDSAILRRTGVLASTMGRLEEAIELTRRAMEQDPLSASAYTAHGRILVQAGRYAEAEGTYRKTLELAPWKSNVPAFLALATSWQRRHEGAIAEAMREPHDLWRLWALAIVYQVAGHTKESETALQELSDKYAEGGAYQISEAYAMREEVDAAFAWLERAHVQRDGGLIEVKVSPYLRSLHSDGRWAEFLEKWDSADSLGREAVDQASPTGRYQILLRAALGRVGRVPGRSRFAERESIVMPHQRVVLARVARPILAGRGGGLALHRRTGQDVVPVGRALRVDRAPLLVERGVVVNVGLVGVKLRDI